VRELLARIRAVLRRTRMLPPNMQVTESVQMLGFGEWRLDTTHRHLLDSAGTMVALSGAEYRLLRVFLDHPQRVLNRDQLLNLTQGRDADIRPFDRPAGEPPAPAPGRWPARAALHQDAAQRGLRVLVRRRPWRSAVKPCGVVRAACGRHLVRAPGVDPVVGLVAAQRCRSGWCSWNAGRRPSTMMAAYLEQDVVQLGGAPGTRAGRGAAVLVAEAGAAQLPSSCWARAPGVAPRCGPERADRGAADRDGHRPHYPRYQVNGGAGHDAGFQLAFRCPMARR
jgi:hypothetical protein